jgi:superfamily II DNA or RNA helicase
MDYRQFIGDKLSHASPVGIPDWQDLPPSMFPFQAALSRWAIARGRAAIFADTGLGKTRMQLAWADAVTRHTGGAVLILAPLAVAQQTRAEGEIMGVAVDHLRQQGETPVRSITITNYERLHLFSPDDYTGVVLDESSCIKHHDAKTLHRLLSAFRDTPYKLCATATPAPNDWTELGTHAEFLGICTRTEMLSEYFCHDGGETQVWRLKGHARHEFWRWVCSWGALVRKPSDLGFDDSAYLLPPLNVHEHHVETHMASPGMLFAVEAQTLGERRGARKASIGARVKACADIVNTDNDPWIVWCDLNAEADALRQAIPGAVEVRGTDEPDAKEARLLDFAAGRIRVMVTKPSIAGFGLNWQHCANVAFVGVTDSFEAYYQAVRRCWRFGQMRPVNVHVFASKYEGAVVANLRRKERDAASMSDALSAETHDAVMMSVVGASRMTNPYNADSAVKVPSFLEAK